MSSISPSLISKSSSKSAPAPSSHPNAFFPSTLISPFGSSDLNTNTGADSDSGFLFDSNSNVNSNGVSDLEAQQRHHLQQFFYYQRLALEKQKTTPVTAEQQPQTQLPSPPPQAQIYDQFEAEEHNHRGALEAFTYSSSFPFDKNELKGGGLDHIGISGIDIDFEAFGREILADPPTTPDLFSAGLTLPESDYQEDASVSFSGSLPALSPTPSTALDSGSPDSFSLDSSSSSSASGSGSFVVPYEDEPSALLSAMTAAATSTVQSVHGNNATQGMPSMHAVAANAGNQGFFALPQPSSLSMIPESSFPTQQRYQGGRAPSSVQMNVHGHGHVRPEPYSIRRSYPASASLSPPSNTYNLLQMSSTFSVPPHALRNSNSIDLGTIHNQGQGPHMMYPTNANVNVNVNVNGHNQLNGPFGFSHLVVDRTRHSFGGGQEPFVEHQNQLACPSGGSVFVDSYSAAPDMPPVPSYYRQFPPALSVLPDLKPEVILPPPSSRPIDSATTVILESQSQPMSQVSSTFTPSEDDSTSGSSSSCVRNPHGGGRGYVPGETPEDPKKKHKCPICGRGFARLFNLKSHSLTHDPARPKPYTCHYASCTRSFSRLHDLERHQQGIHADGPLMVAKERNITPALARAQERIAKRVARGEIKLATQQQQSNSR